MNKAQLITAIATKVNISKNDIDSVLSQLDVVVTETLAAKEEVVLPGLGKFKPVEKPARTGRNPANGEPVQIAAKTAVKFVASAALKDCIN